MVGHPPVESLGKPTESWNATTDADDDDLAANTRLCAAALRDARPAMAAIGNLVEFWMRTFTWPRDDFRGQAVAHCESVLRRADRALRETVRAARARLVEFAPESTILTHSASSTVRSVVADLPFHMLATASEPGGEGRRFAAEIGLPCVQDEDAPAFVAQVAAVLVGADAVGSEAFVNKVGTGALAQAARSSSTPFFVVAESYKSVACRHPVVGDDAFEAVENEFVTEFLSDDTPCISFAPSR